MIRLHAAIGLLKMDEEIGSEEFNAALAGGDDELAQVALMGLEESHYFGVSLLVDLAHQAGPRQDLLREVVERVKARLLSQLEAEEPEGRYRSAQGLGQIGDSSVRDARLVHPQVGRRSVAEHPSSIQCLPDLPVSYTIR